MSVGIHPGGPRPEGHQLAPETTAEGEVTADKVPQKEPPENSAKVADADSPPESAPDEASDTTATVPANAPAEDASTTSVSEAVEGEEESAEEPDGAAAAENLVSADRARVDTTVAGEVADANIDSEDGTYMDKEDIGEELSDEEIRVEEGCCPPEEVPQELIAEFNKGNLIFKV
jgi:hypothetical protein